MRSAFTLVEMMIVVAIIAILAGLGVPQYMKYVKKSKAVEASRFMKQISDAEVTYFSTQGKYISNLPPLMVDIPSGVKFDFAIDLDGGNVFTADQSGTSCFVIRATSQDDTNDIIYLIYPDKTDALSDGCQGILPNTPADDDEWWDGNVYNWDYFN